MSSPKVKAALLSLQSPLSPPPPATIRQGLMAPERENPEFVAWAQDVIERLRALCVLEGIGPTDSGEVNWMGLAIRLALTYEPRFKIRRKAGAPRKRDQPETIAARRILAEIVAAKRAKKPQPVATIAKNLEGRPELPPMFRNIGWESLRKQIALAEREVVIEGAWRKAIDQMFQSGKFSSASYDPAVHFMTDTPTGLDGLGLTKKGSG